MDERPSLPGHAWATPSLEHALRWTALSPTAAWQLVMTFVMSLSRNSSPLAHLSAPAHLLAAAIAVATARNQRINPVWVLCLCYPLVALDWYIAPAPNGVVSFGTAWQWNCISAVPALLLRGRKALLVPLSVTVAISALLAIHHPEWPINILTGASIVGPAIAIFAAIAGRTLYAFVRRVDADSAAAARARHQVAFTTAASRRAAESARLLHDTIINTLVAIANGVTAGDTDRVRRRCARDIESVGRLLDGASEPSADMLQLAGVGDTLGLDIVRRGMTQDEIDLQIGQLPPAVTNAIRGATTEALVNVSKHAGTRHAKIDVSHERGELVVTISDDGVGFSGHSEPGRGIAESIYARCAEAGVRATVLPGDPCGTTVTLAYSRPTPAADSSGEFLQIVSALQKRGCWVWATAVVVVGVVISPATPPSALGSLFVMLAAVAAISATTWYAHRRTGRVTAGMQAALIVATPVIFLLSLVPVGFGESNMTLWQTLGPSVPLIILLFLVPRARVAIYAIAVLAITATVTTILVWRSAPDVAGDVPIGVLPPVVIAVAGLIFYRGLERITARAATESREAEAAALALDAVRAGAAARSRWQAAGLHASIELLKRITSGTTDPTQARIRAECAREERRLRQLTMLSADLLHIGPWLLATISDAHDRGLDLVLRTGDRDVSDELTAKLLGEPLLAVMHALTSGSAVTVALLPTALGLSLTLVGASEQLSSIELPEHGALCWSKHTIAGQTIVEVAVAANLRRVGTYPSSGHL